MLGGPGLADAGAAIVSVEFAGFAPGVTDVGDSAQAGIGEGPMTVHES